jgi:hypothetical protein
MEHSAREQIQSDCNDVAFESDANLHRPQESEYVKGSQVTMAVECRRDVRAVIVSSQRPMWHAGGLLFVSTDFSCASSKGAQCEAAILQMNICDDHAYDSGAEIGEEEFEGKMVSPGDFSYILGPGMLPTLF